jgi:hypothetical protein
MVMNAVTESRMKPMKTATPLFLSADDEALILEALRIAGEELNALATRHARMLPSSPMTEHMRMLAERMTDLRKVME